MVDLMDPDSEPSDDELRELARRAFADVGARNQQALAKLRAEIDVLREEARKRVADRR